MTTPLEVLLIILLVELIALFGSMLYFKFLPLYKRWQYKRRYSQYVARMTRQASEHAQEMESATGVWAHNTSRMDRVEMLYSLVEGDRRRFMELAGYIGLTKAGSIAYYSRVNRKRSSMN